MKTIIKLLIQLSILLLSSCSSINFINRKYTTGIFSQHNKTLKHNTINVDTLKRYASLNHAIELIKPAISLTAPDDKKIINTLTNSIIKKDSVFRILRKGRDDVFVKKCSGSSLLIILNKEYEIIKVRPLPKAFINKPICTDDLRNPNITLLRAKSRSRLAIFLCLFPMVGLIVSMSALQKTQLAKVNNRRSDFKICRTLSIISTIISVLSTLTLIGLFIYFIIIFLNSLASAFVGFTIM